MTSARRPTVSPTPRTPRRPRSLVPLAVLALVGPAVALGVGAPAPTAAAAAPTCRGQEATIVGERYETVRGTDGPDVIVARDSSDVDAGGGADLVCVSGQSAFVDAGDADDVAAGDAPSRDVLLLTTREAYVTSGVAGSSTDNDDVVRSSRGFTGVDYHGVPTGTIDVRAGGGVGFDAGLDAPWTVDVPAGRLTVGDRPALGFEGLTSFGLGRAGWSSLRFRGSAAGEEVYLQDDPRPSADRPVDVRMGAGPDFVRLAHGHQGVVTGGRDDRDALMLGRTSRSARVGSVDARLAVGRISVSGLDDLVAPAFEDLTLEGYRSVRMAGTLRANVLEATACTAVMEGRGGDDRLFLRRGPACDGPGRLVGRGGTGDDQIRGSSGDDVLLGGPDRDVAEAGRGRDRCQAETTRSCERR